MIPYEMEIPKPCVWQKRFKPELSLNIGQKKIAGPGTNNFFPVTNKLNYPTLLSLLNAFYFRWNQAMSFGMRVDHGQRIGCF